MAGTLQIAWRNLGRNRRRTALTGSALAVGICLGVASYGLVDGMLADLVRALTRYDLGHVQLHQAEFPASKRLDATIATPAPLLARARQIAQVRGVAPRVYSYALLSHGDKSMGAELVGVDPPNEVRVTVLHEQLVSGSYLEAEPTPWPRGRELTAAEQAQDEAITDSEVADAIAEIEALADDDLEATAAQAPRPAVEQVTAELAHILSPPPQRPPRVYIGSTLARLLAVQVGDHLHATAPAVDGANEEVELEVFGIFTTGTPTFDRSRVYLHVADLQRFTHLYDRVHEIAITAEQPSQAAAVVAELSPSLPAGTIARGWAEIRPDIVQMLRTSEASMVVTMFIIFFVATLGVVNTMLMAVFERTRELGMLKAIGMSSWHIVRLIVAETLLLVLGSAVVGTLIGLAADLYMVKYGIDLSSFTSGFTMGGVGVSPVLRGAITLEGVLMPTVVLSATCLLASLYPAIRAARLQPAVGMRET